MQLSLAVLVEAIKIELRFFLGGGSNNLCMQSLIMDLLINRKLTVQN